MLLTERFVIEVAAHPSIRLRTLIRLAKTVVDAAVVADVPAPVSAVEAIAVNAKNPNSRESRVRPHREPHPGAGHPVVAGRRPAPVAGRPR